MRESPSSPPAGRPRECCREGEWDTEIDRYKHTASSRKLLVPRPLEYNRAIDFSYKFKVIILKRRESKAAFRLEDHVK
eukprot:scaffold7028_cov28-Tisochrysis_lutea.AAC.1